MSNKRGVKNGNDEANNSECYFCNELFELGQLQIHLKQCGSILEQCPLRCGAWIQRRHRDTHTQECPRVRRRGEPRPGSTHAPAPDPSSPPPPPAPMAPPAHTWTPNAVPISDCVSYLEKEVAAIRISMCEDTNQKSVRASELDTVRTRLALLDERLQHVLATLSAVRAALDDEAERSANCSAQLKRDVADVQLALQDLQSQQMSTALRLETTVGALSHEQNERELLERALDHQDSRLRTVDKLVSVVEHVRAAVEEERDRNQHSRAALEAELQEARRSSQQLVQLAALRHDLQAHAETEQPALDRLAVVEVATATVRAETADQASRVDSLARDLRALSKSYLKLRTELVDFQSKISFDASELGGDNGHLIWRIDNFTARMKEAKDSDCVISSSPFRTSKYGYTLKAELHLNGIGKWRGRHITSTVRLLGGRYDPLLQWPCDLAINIILKDQPNDRRQAMDIVKSLQLRRKSSSKRHDYDSGDQTETTRSNETLDRTVTQLKRQYIFIPHTSLDKFEYIKNDVLFFEFIVNQ